MMDGFPRYWGVVLRRGEQLDWLAHHIFPVFISHKLFAEIKPTDLDFFIYVDSENHRLAGPLDLSMNLKRSPVSRGPLVQVAMSYWDLALRFACVSMPQRLTQLSKIKKSTGMCHGIIPCRNLKHKNSMNPVSYWNMLFFFVMTTLRVGMAFGD